MVQSAPTVNLLMFLVPEPCAARPVSDFDLCAAVVAFGDVVDAFGVARASAAVVEEAVTVAFAATWAICRRLRGSATDRAADPARQRRGNECRGVPFLRWRIDAWV